MVRDQALGLVRNIGLVGLCMAAADYAMQRRRIGKQTRMSKEEIKQEHKQTEGDPLVKGAIRSRQLAAARNRMMADVATADVVLVNPTHVAVALRYDAQSGAPRVVARGAGAVAAKIRERGRGARVPLVRDVPLARALYRSTKVGQEIPPELFAAVAQVLAFVISRRSRGQRGGEHRSPAPEGELPAGAGRRAAAPSSQSQDPAQQSSARRTRADRDSDVRTTSPLRHGRRRLGRWSDVHEAIMQLGVPVGIVFIVVMLVVPLPAILLDLLIALNITGALLILLTAMFINKPLDFAAFPSVVLGRIGKGWQRIRQSGLYR